MKVKRGFIVKHVVPLNIPSRFFMHRNERLRDAHCDSTCKLQGRL